MHAERIVLDPRKQRCSRLRRTLTESAREHELHADWDSRQLGRSAYRKTFLTLTYAQAGAWRKRHVSDFLRHLRQWFARRGALCRYVWVAELQKRGALHYHLVVWVPRRLRLPQPDRSGWWPHGASKIETARNPIGYMVKYATKTRPEDLKRLPKGVRLHGNGGHDAAARTQVRERLMPTWLIQEWDRRRFEHLDAQEQRTEESESDYYARIADEADAWIAYRDRWGAKGWPTFVRVRGGFMNCHTGEVIESPWRVEVEGGVVTCVKKTEVTQ